MTSDPIKLQLDSDEALVLFEFLSRYSDSDKLEIQDQAEQRVLWNVCSELERLLTVQFAESYSQHLEDARAKIRE